MGWHILPPLTWHAFLWQEPNKPRAIEVAFAGALTHSHIGARHSEVTAAITERPHARVVTKIVHRYGRIVSICGSKQAQFGRGTELVVNG